ncbi:MAG: tryptophan synthase subunit alpha [Dehalococcoidia bacterium]|nr:tryptophan synthase subunit alpha [Dehalococcoidia bacterium]MSQ34785.1 tryptophan synthase subunit alpha [Dehalococcoidia bacterium]
MADRTRQAFEKAKAQGRIALAPFVTVGYPSPAATPGIVKAIVEAGADVVELGVPFSDPLAEGPTIQKSSFAALEQGVTPQVCIDIAAGLRRDGVKTPFIFMGYYNPVLAFGMERFCDRAAAAGVDGLIVADLPPEEAGPLTDIADRRGLIVVPLLALTSTDERIALGCRRAGGFVYCVSVLGVTGARTAMSERVRGLAGKVRAHTALPVGVGFGISKPQHVADVAMFADGAIVGSALIDAISAGPESGAAERAGAFIRSLASGTKRIGASK